MRVLLCLLSAQHVPNLLSVHHYQPDRLVLIESHGMQKKRAAANLLAALKLGGLDYANQPGGERSHVEPLENEDDLEAIRRTCTSIRTLPRHRVAGQRHGRRRSPCRLRPTTSSTA